MASSRNSRLIALLLFAAGPIAAQFPLDQPRRFERTEPHLGTTVKITLYAASETAANGAFEAAFLRINSLNQTLSDYSPDSELNRATNLACHAPVLISSDLFRVLSLASQIAQETKGAFDPTIGPLSRLWRESRTSGKLPDPARIGEARSKSGYGRIQLDPSLQTLSLERCGMQLDLGGIAKGYIAGEALQLLKDLGYPHALVAIGGDLAIGEAPPGRQGWRVAIEDLAGEQEGPVLTLASRFVSTSGDTEQFVQIGGRRYSHIVDPETGLGLTRRVMVTVIGGDGASTDAYATALSVMELEDAREFVQWGSIAVRMSFETSSGVSVWESEAFRELQSGQTRAFSGAP